MTSVFVVGAAVALVITVAVLHRERGPRTRLLRLAATTILVSALLREYGGLYGDTVLLDLVKRLLFLTTEASVVALLLTYRRRPVTRRGYLSLWTLTGAAGIIECLLAVVMPTTSEGRLYAYTDASGSTAVFLYYALYELTIAATALTCSVGSISVLVRTWQPFSTRVSLTLMTLAAGATAAYVGIGWFSLVEEPGFNHTAVRQQLFLAVVVLLLAGLALGGIRRIVVQPKDDQRRSRQRGRGPGR